MQELPVSSTKRKPLPIPQPGDKFGRLTVIECGPIAKHRVVHCRCECGVDKTIDLRSVLIGAASSCGCRRNEVSTAKATKHGGSKSPEYVSWESMKTRCSNPKGKYWRHYGGRGIKVCDRWLNDFAAFLADVGKRPAPGYSIDRHPDPSGDYEPGNVRWATQTQQTRNQRTNRIVHYRGEPMSLAEACSLAGAKYDLVRDRVVRGWSLESAIETPRRANAATAPL